MKRAATYERVLAQLLDAGLSYAEADRIAAETATKIARMGKQERAA